MKQWHLKLEAPLSLALMTNTTSHMTLLRKSKLYPVTACEVPGLSLENPTSSGLLSSPLCTLVKSKNTWKVQMF